MLLDSIRIIDIEEPFMETNTLTEREGRLHLLTSSTPIVKLQYLPPFKMNRFRLTCLFAVLMNEDVTFIIGENLCKGRVIQCKFENYWEINSFTIFDEYKGYVDNDGYDTYGLHFKIQITEVSSNE